MVGKRLLQGGISLLLMAVLFSACAKTPASPTPDKNMMITELAGTIQAQLTQTAEALPKATFTSTPAPTNTITPTVLATTAPVLTNTPALTSTATRPAVSDKAEYLGQDPKDDTVFAPGQTFTMTWQLKNTGATTWSTKYSFRYFFSDPTARFSASDITLPKEVKPGETANISLQMTAPTTPGEYTSSWVLTNQDGVNFSSVNVRIKVSGTAVTVTVTPTTAISTSTPTVTVVSVTETPTVTTVP